MTWGKSLNGPEGPSRTEGRLRLFQYRSEEEKERERLEQTEGKRRTGMSQSVEIINIHCRNGCLIVVSMYSGIKGGRTEATKMIMYDYVDVGEYYIENIENMTWRPRYQLDAYSSSFSSAKIQFFMLESDVMSQGNVGLCRLPCPATAEGTRDLRAAAQDVLLLI